MTDPTQDPDKENAATNGLSDQDPTEAGGLSEELDDDWAAALSEQAAASRGPTQADGLQDDMDDWAAALAEQTAASPSGVAEDQDKPGSTAGNVFSSPAPTATPATQQVFQPLVGSGSGGNSDIDLIMDIPVQLSVELGRTKLTIKNILQLGQGSVVELDGLAGEPMDIFVNGYLIAQGEVVVVDDKYGIRLTDIITPSDRLHRLNSRR